MGRKSVTKKDYSSIFDDNSFDEEESVVSLKISDIEPNKEQPRKYFDTEGLKTLADSIRENGIIQPLLVRSLNDGTYKIVAGERRWRAAKMAGLTEVPVFIRDMSELQAAQLALIENLQRENLNPIEEANGYKELMEKFGMTQDEVAKVVGKARSSVANSLRLLELPQAVMDMVAKNLISSGHCKALLGIKDPVIMMQVATRAADNGYSVRETERAVKNLEAQKKEEPKKDNFYVESEIILTRILNTKVNIVPGKKKNTLEIEFFSKEDLTDIVNKIQGK